jgi:hypothetical protein
VFVVIARAETKGRALPRHSKRRELELDLGSRLRLATCRAHVEARQRVSEALDGVVVRERQPPS